MPSTPSGHLATSASPEFLGYDGPLLARAAERIVDGAAGPEDLGELLIAVPGARAGRRLAKELRACASSRGWAGYFAPTITTPGALADALLPLEHATADRTTRTLAWEGALVGARPEMLLRILSRPPARSDRAAWWRVAEELRVLHGELAQWGHDFASVRKRLETHSGCPVTELRRWEALAAIQGAWRAKMSEIKLSDPHEGRLQALESGRVERGARVVLVGVLEMNLLLRDALRALDEAPRVLVFAPEVAAEGFDDLGALVAPRWEQAEVDLPLDQWHVVGTPEDQARLALSLAAQAAPAHAGELTVGVPDGEVAPLLVRRFGAADVHARSAAGTPLGLTAPMRLVAALEAFARARTAENAASLVRHADLARWLAGRLGHDPVARLDRYRPEHLPRTLDPSPEGGVLDLPGQLRGREDIRPLLDAVAELGGALFTDTAAPLVDQVGRLREVLVLVYGDHPMLEPPRSSEPARQVEVSLRRLGAVMDELERMPAAVAGRMTPADALRLVHWTAGGAAVPDPVGEEGQPVVELLGWLELLLDGAPHLVVTGFNETKVPEPSARDPFLPDSIRTLLGLEDDARRTARDVYTMIALLHSKRSLHFISGRVTRDGDPLFPSRLAFRAGSGDVAARVDHALEPVGFAPVEASDRDVSAELPPVVADPRPQDRFAVTSFKSFLDSPLLYYVQRVLHLEAVDDRAGELDALRFGTLAHDVLEDLGTNEELRESTSVEDVEGYLLDRLDRRAAMRFPRAVMPAVQIQLGQLRLRLGSFALWHVGEVRDGWRIRHAEWSPEGDASIGREGCARLDMGPGEEPAWIRGKIDRIEQHSKTGIWRVLDYKTSHKSNDPAKVHRKKNGDWKDLQLPLYAHMVEPLVGKGVVPGLGYVNLPGDGTRVELKLVAGKVTWGPEDIQDALECARGVVRRVRAGDVEDLGRVKTEFMLPIERELLGVGLVREPDPVADDEEERS